MSATTGRMSRADAVHTLTQILSAANEFHTPDAPADVRAEANVIHRLANAEQDRIDHLHPVHKRPLPGTPPAPDAAAIRALRTRVAALQAARLANSLETAPRTTAAAVVTLYGLQADDSRRAAGLAAEQLGFPSWDHVRLQDSSHVRTATLTGTRYIFTSHTP